MDMPTYKINFSSERKERLQFILWACFFYIFIVMSLIIRSKSHIFLVQFSLVLRAEALS